MEQSKPKQRFVQCLFFLERFLQPPAMPAAPCQPIEHPVAARKSPENSSEWNLITCEKGREEAGG